MGHEVALESVQQARGWLDAIRAGEQPSAPLPEPPPESPVKPVTTAEFDTEVLRVGRPGDRRLLGALVRTLPPGRARSSSRSRTMRKGAYKVVKVNIDEEPDARAAVRRAEHPAHRAVPQRSARACLARRQAASPARSRARDARHPLTRRSLRPGYLRRGRSLLASNSLRCRRHRRRSAGSLARRRVTLVAICNVRRSHFATFYRASGAGAAGPRRRIRG